MEINKQTIIQYSKHLDKKFSTNKKKHHYEWYVNHIKEQCVKLEKKYFSDRKVHKIRLIDMENELFTIYANLDLTINEFKEILHNLGICITTFHCYGSVNSLSKELKKRPKLWISKFLLKTRVAKKLWEYTGYPKFEEIDDYEWSSIKYYTSKFFTSKSYVTEYMYYSWEDFLYFTKIKHEFLKSLLIKIDGDTNEDQIEDENDYNYDEVDDHFNINKFSEEIEDNNDKKL